MHLVRKHLAGVVLAAWLVNGALCMAQGVAGLQGKSGNSYLPHAGNPHNAQMSQEARAHYETCPRLILAHGEPYPKIKAALEIIVSTPDLTPAQTAKVLRPVRLNRLPRNLVRPIESYYLLCEAQTGGGVEMYRLYDSAAELAAWASISPAETMKLVAQAAPAGPPGPPGPPRPPIVPPGGDDPPAGGGRFDPANVAAIQEAHLHIRAALLPQLKLLLKLLDQKDDRKVESSLDGMASTTTWGQHGQLQEIIIAAAEDLAKRKLTDEEKQQVWEAWLAGESLVEICARLRQMAADAKPAPRKSASFIPLRQNPPASQRACIKTYASFCELEAEQLLKLTPVELGVYRERIESWTAAHDLQLPATSKAQGEARLRSSLSQGMSAEQVRLYGDYLLLKALAAEGDWQGLVKLFAAIEANRGLRPQFVLIDEAESYSHYSEGSLQNLILLYGIIGRLASSPDDAIPATRELLDGRYEFSRYIPLLRLDDPETDEDETNTRLFSAVYKLAMSRPEAFTDGNRVEQLGATLRVTLQSGKRTHTVEFDKAGNVSKVQSGS